MAFYPRLMPQNPHQLRAQVAASTRLSPTFQRVTIVGDELAEFEWSGYDHWFRLFLPPNSESDLTLPTFSSRGWYLPYLAIPASRRPHYSSYTVSSVRHGERGDELDIDVVLH